MKKRISQSSLSWLNVLKGVGIFVGAIVLVGGVALAVYAVQSTSRDKQLDEMKVVLKDVQRRLYERQSAGIFGGKTPAETIYLYYEFLESRDFPVLSTYFIPGNRAVELTRFSGVSEKAILAFVEELRAAEILARTADPNASLYTMDSPVRLELKKMENGIWEFVYIDRSLR